MIHGAQLSLATNSPELILLLIRFQFRWNLHRLHFRSFIFLATVRIFPVTKFFFHFFGGKWSRIFFETLEANPLKALLTVIYKFVNSGFYKIPCSHKFCQIQQDYRCIHLKIPRSTLADELALVATSKLKRPVFSNLKIPVCKLS